MLGEEDFQQPGVADLLRIEGDQNRFGVSGLPRTDLFIGGVGSETVLVADRGGVDAVELPEETFGPPETAEREICDFDPDKVESNKRKMLKRELEDSKYMESETDTVDDEVD